MIALVMLAGCQEVRDLGFGDPDAGGHDPRDIGVEVDTSGDVPVFSWDGTAMHTLEVDRCKRRCECGFGTLLDGSGEHDAFWWVISDPDLAKVARAEPAIESPL